MVYAVKSEYAQLMGMDDVVVVHARTRRPLRLPANGNLEPGLYLHVVLHAGHGSLDG